KFLIVRQADAHVAGFKPGIIASLAAMSSHIAGGAFVLLIRPGLIHGLLEDFPSLLDCSFPQIKFGEWKRYAQIHLAVGGDGKTIAAARTGDKVARDSHAGLFGRPLAVTRVDHVIVYANLISGTETVRQR